MRIWNRLRGSWRGWPWKKTGPTRPPDTGAEDEPLVQVRESLGALLADRRVPDSVRRELAGEYAALEAMLDRLENGHLYIAAVGRVSVGKSSLLNALLGREAFGTSALHGETREPAREVWRESEDGHVYLYDTPGIDDPAGEEREELAYRTAATADLVLFVVDSDLTGTEWRALQRVCAEHRPVLLALNKADRYTAEECRRLLARLRERTQDLLGAGDVVACAARPASRRMVVVDEAGEQHERLEPATVEMTDLVERLWAVIEREGRTLAALNAGMFASRLSDRVAARVTEIRRDLVRRLTEAYALGKGVAVAVNPVPVADLAGAAALDVTLILHQSRVYGLPLTRRQSGRLVAVILAQLSALTGTLWSVNLFASLLKAGSGGLSTALTATTQGAVGYASTWVLGRVAEDYFRRGGAWGPQGPKRAVEAVLEDIDRESLLQRARTDIRRALRSGA